MTSGSWRSFDARALAGALTGALLLAGCAGGPHPSAPVASGPTGKPPADKSVAALARPLAGRVGFAEADLAPALTAFRRSCPKLLRRTDVSGLARADDWVDACAAAATATDARAFFTSQFVPVTVGSGAGLDTGYFEPELAASRTRRPGFDVPLYRRPADLVDLDLGSFNPDLTGKHVRGRVAGATFVPYYDRAAIEDGALAGRHLELAWAADPYDAFFLEIQGSGRLRLPDGTIMRVGYDGQNGRGYTAIGKLLRDRGVLAPGQATMDGIIGWMRAHPDDGKALMRQNLSYVFFAENTAVTDGPNGALGVALTPQASVAGDPRFVPLGAPVWLDTQVDGRPFRRLVVAQDTGGAIKGENRFDIFWGAGEQARATAGGLSSTGAATILLPPAAAARLRHGPSASP